MNPLRFLPILALIASSAAACAAPAAGQEDDDLSSTASEIGSTATISFDESFEQHISGGTLQAGRSVNVTYDAARLETCRGEQGGIPQWSITGFYKIDDSPVKSFPAGGLALANGVRPTVVLDRPGDLQIWFQNTGRSGCSAFDSDFGKNYHFAVE